MKKLILVVCWLLASMPLLAQPYGTGLVFDDKTYEQAKMKVPLTRGLYGEYLPASVNMKPYCPTPKSQGDLGTCVGWATNWAARTMVAAMHGQWQDPLHIEANAFSPGFIYHVIKDKKDQDCTFGASIFDALNYMKFNGTIKNADYKEQCGGYIDEQMLVEAEAYRIKDFARLFDKEKSDRFKVQAIKKSLAERNPVIIGIKCPPSFYLAREVWEPTEDPETIGNGHAVCVVGYDDSKFGGAFEIMNSWGTRWANGGFAWIRYSDFGRFTKYAYEMIHEPPQSLVAVNPAALPSVVTELPSPRPSPVPEPEAPSAVVTPGPEKVRPVVARPQLAGSLKLLTDRGNEMRAARQGGIYRMKKAWRSGTSFRIYLNNDQPAYVYVLGSDATGEIFQLFPWAPHISAALNYQYNQVALPDEDHYITLDETIGTDVLCVLYSKQELDINNIKNRMAMFGGSFAEKLGKVLGRNLAAPDDVRYRPGQMAFEAWGDQQQSVVPLIVEIEHVE